jgi:hypothetical protein
VTFALLNRASAARFTEANRSSFFGVTLAHKHGDRWSDVAYEAGTCSQPCDVEAFSCDFENCLPSHPAAGRLAAGKRVEHRWDGTLYRSSERDRCPCHRIVPAPHGRYRLSLCVQSDIDCPAECPSGDWTSVRHGHPLGEKRCYSAEFDFRGADAAVALEVGR